VNAFCVDPAQVHAIWPHASDLVRRAIAATKLSDFALIERDVLAGDALLWLVIEDRTIAAAVVTQLSIVDGEKYCTIVACAGEGFAGWSHFLARLHEFGKAEGCKAMRIFGRKGWARMLPDYKTHAVILQKELT
jgi:hypothetical protein